MKLRYDASSATNGHISVWSGYGTSESDPVHASVSFSSINQFLLSDGVVPGFSTAYYDQVSLSSGDSHLETDVLVLGNEGAGHDFTTGYVFAGTNGTDSMTIDGTFDGAIVFAKGGQDTINIQTSSGLTVIGGITEFDNKDSDSDGVLDQYINTMDYSGWATDVQAITAYLHDGDAGISFGSSYDDGHELWDVGSLTGTTLADTIVVASGTYGTISGDAGNDTFTVFAFDDPYTTYEDETYTNLTLSSLKGGAGSGDAFTVAVTSGTHTADDYFKDNTNHSDLYSFYNTDFATQEFEIAGLTGLYANGSVDLTGFASTPTLLIGSYNNDTLTGGSGADTFVGGAGSDTITGGGGNDIFSFTSTSLGSGDLFGGTGDTTDADAGDMFDFTSAIEDVLVIGGITLSSLTSNTALASSLDSSNTIAYTASDEIVLDFDGDGNSDFSITVDSSVANATYDFTNDVVALSV